MSVKTYPSFAVLLVDDEPAWLRSLPIILERSAGITNVVTCQDSRKALDLIEQHNVGLVLLDHTMPHLSGEELLRQIAERHPPPEHRGTHRDGMDLADRHAQGVAPQPDEVRLLAGADAAGDVLQPQRPCAVDGVTAQSVHDVDALALDDVELARVHERGDELVREGRGLELLDGEADLVGSECRTRASRALPS